jgi:hypothetical protein
MKKMAGLWIDHRKAVIVMVSAAGEQIREITSKMEKHTRFTGGNASLDGSTEDVRDRQFGNHLNRYYDEVIAVIKTADSIQIFGPGEAKHELVRRLEHDGMQGCVLSVETVDKMTDHQVMAKVREQYTA